MIADRREDAVKFSFSSEQEEFRSNLRRLLADRSPTKEVRRLMETDEGYERDGWHAIDNAFGLTAIRIPEAYGGYGLSFGDQGVVLEEMGRALRCVFRNRGARRRRRHQCRHRGRTAKTAARHRRRRDDRDIGLGRG